MLNEPQLRAVRWYIGDVEGDDPFWGDPKAYVTLNALFFPGIQAEQARASEGKRLNPAILEDVERLNAVLHDLLSAFSPLPEPAGSCRVERYSDYLIMKQQGSSTLSFTSTSTAGFLRAYQDRIGIALMRFRLPAGTPVIDMGRMLPHYLPLFIRRRKDRKAASNSFINRSSLLFFNGSNVTLVYLIFECILRQFFVETSTASPR